MLLPKPNSLAFSRSGFTLIELLVTSALSLVLVGSSLFAYSNYQTRQSQVATAKQVIAALNTARNRSSAGDKPGTNCTTLQGYRVRALADDRYYFVSARCEGLSPSEEETFALAEGYVFLENGFDIVFPHQPAPVSASDITLNIGKVSPSDDDVYRFTILPSGVIEDQGLVAR